MPSKKKSIFCPTCGKQGIWDPQNAFRPFCSERCKLIDLGDWAAEKHRIPGKPVNPDEEKNKEEDKE